MVKWVRSGVMEGAPELVTELGGDYRALAREAGVPLRPLANPDLPMRVDRFLVFMELAAAKLGEPAFGLKLGPRQTLSLFGPMASLLGSAATVRAMILDLADFFPLHTQGTIVGLEPMEGGLLLTYELSAEVGSQQRQVIELGFSVVAREMRRHDPAWKPGLVTMRHSAPADRGWHTRAGGVVVFRGLTQGSAKVMTEALGKVLKPGERMDGVGIDPRLFRAFAVSEIPAYVVTASDFDLCSGFDCTSAVPPYDRMNGNVTAEYALRTFAEGGGPGARIAAQHLARLQGDQP